MTTSKLTEEQIVFMTRNALLAAGQEMGADDAWPVIDDTIVKIMKDWEDLKIERDVDAEMRIHLYEQLKVMEAGLAECAPDVREQAAPHIQALREACDAYFEEINPDAMAYDEEDAPDHIKRMKAILGTMEEDHE
ncbi:MAG: hypothetical protein PHS57_07485 [Alphaproteobacteria bacterium]|nr:hypothetical protein [Alphaproteobacteria bacterium]